jgi:hypothetical protein
MKKLGYREMLRDRCPKVVSHALKWQKAKEKWIEHVYAYFIRILGDEIDINDKVVRTAKDNKRAVMSILLGMKKGRVKDFDFKRTIDWDNLSDEECVYWERVSSWVRWFCTKYAYCENAYLISKRVGKDEESIKIEIITSYLGALMPSADASDEEKQAKYDYVDKFVEFLIKCFENKI